MLSTMYTKLKEHFGELVFSILLGLGGFGTLLNMAVFYLCINFQYGIFQSLRIFHIVYFLGPIIILLILYLSEHHRIRSNVKRTLFWLILFPLLLTLGMGLLDNAFYIITLFCMFYFVFLQHYALDKLLYRKETINVGDSEKKKSVTITTIASNNLREIRYHFIFSMGIFLYGAGMILFQTHWEMYSYCSFLFYLYFLLGLFTIRVHLDYYLKKLKKDNIKPENLQREVRIIYTLAVTVAMLALFFPFPAMRDNTGKILWLCIVIGYSIFVYTILFYKAIPETDKQMHWQLLRKIAVFLILLFCFTLVIQSRNNQNNSKSQGKSKGTAIDRHLDALKELITPNREESAYKTLNLMDKANEIKNYYENSSHPLNIALDKLDSCKAAVNSVDEAMKLGREVEKLWLLKSNTSLKGIEADSCLKGLRKIIDKNKDTIGSGGLISKLHNIIIEYYDTGVGKFTPKKHLELLNEKYKELKDGYDTIRGNKENKADSVASIGRIELINDYLTHEKLFRETCYHDYLTKSQTVAIYCAADFQRIGMYMLLVMFVFAFFIYRYQVALPAEFGKSDNNINWPENNNAGESNATNTPNEIANQKSETNSLERCLLVFLMLVIILLLPLLKPIGQNDVDGEKTFFGLFQFGNWYIPNVFDNATAPPETPEEQADKDKGDITVNTKYISYNNDSCCGKNYESIITNIQTQINLVTEILNRMEERPGCEDIKTMNETLLVAVKELINLKVRTGGGSASRDSIPLENIATAINKLKEKLDSLVNSQDNISTNSNKLITEIEKMKIKLENIEKILKTPAKKLPIPELDGI